MEQLDVFQHARELLANVTLAEYLASQPPRTVISITASDPLSQVLRRFASASLVAAPCFADEARTRFLGFLDLMDVVAAVVDAARHQGPGTPTAGSDIGGGSTCLSRHSLAARCRSGVARELAEQPVSALRATSNDAQLVYQAQLSNNLLQVVRQGFTHPVDHLACHRLAVFMPAGGVSGGGDWDDNTVGGGDGDPAGMTTAGIPPLQVTHIVSQSDMLQFLYKHRARLGNTLLGSTLRQVRPGFCAAKFGAPLAVLTPGTGGLAPTSFCIRMPLQLGVQERQVLCVPAELAVIDALAGMVDARVPAVAVIDSEESGRLLGNLSISDLRGLQPLHFEQLAKPVGDFLREGGWHGGSRWRAASPRGGVAAKFGVRSPDCLPHQPPLAVCHLDSTLGEVLGLLAGRRLHRLFIVDGERRPLGVVSIADILTLLAG